MKEMKGRKRREREWKSQLGKWRRSRRAPSGKFGSGIREFYHGVQWPTRVSAHIGSNCLPLLAGRKRTGVYVIFSPPTPSLWIIKRPLVKVSVLSTANEGHYEWAIKLPHHRGFLQDLLFLVQSDISSRRITTPNCLVWCLPTVVSKLGFNMTDGYSGYLFFPRARY